MEPAIIIYFCIYAILVVYHGYTEIGLIIFSLNAFKLGKLLKYYNNIDLNYTRVIENLNIFNFEYNDKLYKNRNILLARPKMSFFSLSNNFYKFRVIMSKNTADDYNVSLYCDNLYKYSFFLFIYFLPFIFTFGMLFEYSFHIKGIIISFSILVALLIPFVILPSYLQNKACNNFIKKFENILFK